MEIAFARGAWRQWKGLSREIQSRLHEKLLIYAREPFRHAVKITDAKIGQYRFRVGDHRIVFDIGGDKIIILAVGHRKDIYK